MKLKQATLDEIADMHALAHVTGYARYDSLYTLAALARKAKPRRILELGVYRGASTVFLATACPRAELVGIDDFTLSSRDVVEASLKRFGVARRVRLIEGDTRNANELTAGPFELVFFDACHTNDGVAAEYQAVKPLLAPRALLVVDDALHVNATLTAMGARGEGMRAYSVHFGLCAIIHDAERSE